MKKKVILLFLVFCLILLPSCGSGGEADDKKEMTLAEIEKLAETGVFNVTWSTTEGDYSAGTSYLIDSPQNGGKLLVTAFHYLWPDDAKTFTGPELPGYVKGGSLYYAQSGKDTGATLKCNLVIPDADAVPNIAKDVAAFTLKNAESLATLKLSTRRPEPGEKIYLLARLWDGEVLNENCVYECQVVRCSEHEIVYTLDKKYGTTMGASGLPGGQVWGIPYGQGFMIPVQMMLYAVPVACPEGSVPPFPGAVPVSLVPFPMNQEDKKQ